MIAVDPVRRKDEGEWGWGGGGRGDRRRLEGTVIL